MNFLPPEISAYLASLNAQELAWLSGFCYAKSQENKDLTNQSFSGSVSEKSEESIHIISASQTGNARSVADKLTRILQEQGINATHTHAANYKTKNLAHESRLIFITSTQGEGEPPEEAIALFHFLQSKKAPNLSQLSYAVLGLGDSSYPQFCGAAKAFDERFAALGATRLIPLHTCDLDFQAAAEEWIKSMAQTLAKDNNANSPLSCSLKTESAPFAKANYDKDHPFSASVLTTQKITGRFSEKHVQHIELDLSDSGLTYREGDALGVWFRNDPELVCAILNACQLNPDEIIEGKSLKNILENEKELTQNTPTLIRAWIEHSKNKTLEKAFHQEGNALAQNLPILGMMEKYPAAISAESLLKLLRPLSPRLYSIASSQKEVGNEVHLCVNALRFEHEGKTHFGSASRFLTHTVQTGDKIPIYIEHNPHFRLPEKSDSPVIMIAAGVGIAPFRSFMQARAAEEVRGKNWLFFGNQRAQEDFLYQTEWQAWAKDGVLNRYAFAFSRDGKEKVYVQHKIRQHQKELWQWLEEGAYIYICGDAKNMAKEVQNALIQVIQEEGKMTQEEAENHLNELREAKRYQRDVY